LAGTLGGYFHAQQLGELFRGRTLRRPLREIAADLEGLSLKFLQVNLYGFEPDFLQFVLWHLEREQRLLG
jgi:hypothetical protein